MAASQVACTTEQLVPKEISTLLADALDDILQCTYEKERTGVLSLVYFVEQIFFHLLRWKCWTRLSTNPSQNILKTVVPVTRLVKSYYQQMPLWNQFPRSYNLGLLKPSLRNALQQRGETVEATESG